MHSRRPSSLSSDRRARGLSASCPGAFRLGLLILTLAVCCLSARAEEARRYRLTLKFSGPEYRWSRTVTFREEFHLILDKAPLGEGYWGFVTGVIYPKKDGLYATLGLGKMRDKIETDGASLGGVRYRKLPRGLSIEAPMESKDFQRCTATFTPVK